MCHTSHHTQHIELHTVKQKSTRKPKLWNLGCSICVFPYFCSHFWLFLVRNRPSFLHVLTLITREHTHIESSKLFRDSAQQAKHTFLRRNSSMLFKSLVLAMIWTQSFCQCTESKATLLIFTLRLRLAFGEGSLFSLNSLWELPGSSGLKGGAVWCWGNSKARESTQDNIFSKDTDNFYIPVSRFLWWRNIYWKKHTNIWKAS